MIHLARFFFCVSLLINSHANAATVSIGVGLTIPPSPAIFIDGEILKGDLLIIQKTSKEVIFRDDFSTLKYYLNSEGGDVAESIIIGEFFRDVLADVAAPGVTFIDPKSKNGNDTQRYRDEGKNAHFFQFTLLREPHAAFEEKEIRKCYSACVFMLYGGVKKSTGDNFSLGEQNKRIPVIGIHRPSYPTNHFSGLTAIEAREQYGRLESIVRSFLEKMGAPEELADKMFASASNELELIEASKFQKFYQSTEPYLEEWLLAKCGVTGSDRWLSPDDLLFYSNVNAEKQREVRKDVKNYASIFDSYMPSGLSKQRYDRLMSLVQLSNREVHNCRETAISTHQREWASAL